MFSDEDCSLLCMFISILPGVDRFYKDIELMIGFRPCGLWKIMWKYVTPVVILVSLTLFIIYNTPS